VVYVFFLVHQGKQLFFFFREKEGTGGEGIVLIRAGSAGSVLRTWEREQGSTERYLRACTPTHQRIAHAGGRYTRR
jgi:hypothetical protein